MRERTVEQALTQTVRAAGGLCWKFTSPGLAGVPDRIILLAGNKIGFIEVKAPGHPPRPIQLRRLEQIRALGIPALVIDHPDQIPGAINAIRTA